MNLNPTCPRCKQKMTWIGIGPGAEPCCVRGCSALHPDEICPKCQSTSVDDFEVQAAGPMGWFGPAIAVMKRRCLPCGHVFDKAT